LRWSFFQFLRHSKGEWSGQRIQLEAWQRFYLATLFGWHRADGSRRFRTSYLEVARKNGKSTLAAGIGLYLLIADGEPGAEIYVAATRRDQARIIWSEAARMVKQSPDLRRFVGQFKDNLSVERTFSKLEPVGRDSDTLDGLNVHAGLIDELHAHPTGEMWDVSGVIDDPAWHGLIYSLDVDQAGQLEDWQDESNWIKANPNLGVSKKWADMRDKAHKAAYLPARLNVFLRKELNIWTQASTRWIHPDAWRSCYLRPIDEAALAGRPCYAGLDLSSTLDLTAWVLIFPPLEGDNVYDVIARYWIPEDNVEERSRRDRVPYDSWVRDGLLEATPGNVIDYDWILSTIRQHSERYQIEEIAFDPWNATSVSNKLIEDGANVVEFRQGYVSMNPAMKALEVAIRRRTINHGGDPVLAWMADNLVAAQDPAGNIKPDRNKSREKIDGMVALIMGHYRARVQVAAAGSIYDERGLLTL